MTWAGKRVPTVIVAVMMRLVGTRATYTMSSPSRTHSERRLPDLRDESLQMGQGELGEGEAGEIGVAEFEHARGEPEEPAVGVDVPEIDEGEQEAAGGRAGQVAGRGRPR